VSIVGRLRERARDDTGAATTTTLVYLTPVLTLVLFAAFQAGLWNHARTYARAQARATASAVARSGANPADAETDAVRNLSARSDLRNVSVDVAVVAERVKVTIKADAPGIVIGTSSPVTVEVAMPVEGWAAP
jgi:Flp pilus assembly protein TadG